jgi:hypothetical protein
LLAARIESPYAADPSCGGADPYLDDDELRALCGLLTDVTALASSCASRSNTPGYRRWKLTEAVEDSGREGGG